MQPIIASTFDDLLRLAVERILEDGAEMQSTRGDNIEVLASHFLLDNPRARLSLSESRSTLFSCLGEFLWYLSQEDRIELVEHYIPNYGQHVGVEGSRVPSAYGPRIFNWNGINQLKNVVDLLKCRPSSKQAVIQIFDREDLLKDRANVPCTCTLQFLLRDEALNLIVNMRSNDVFVGLPHDVFAFTMIQEVAACMIQCEVGRYYHSVGSLHLYKKDETRARKLLEEGWQQTTEAVAPNMPQGLSADDISWLVAAERSIRESTGSSDLPSACGKQYLDDLALLLVFWKHIKDNDANAARECLKSLSSSYYDPFLGHHLMQLKQP